MNYSDRVCADCGAPCYLLSRCADCRAKRAEIPAVEAEMSVEIELVRAEALPKWKKPGSNDAEIVLGKVGAQWTTHMRIIPPKPSVPYLVWGHYFDTEKEARADFEERLRRGA